MHERSRRLNVTHLVLLCICLCMPIYAHLFTNSRNTRVWIYMHIYDLHVCRLCTYTYALEFTRDTTENCCTILVWSSAKSAQPIRCRVHAGEGYVGKKSGHFSKRFQNTLTLQFLPAQPEKHMQWPSSPHRPLPKVSFTRESYEAKAWKTWQKWKV